MSWCGVWVESHTVSRPSSPNSAIVARGSTGQAASRWLSVEPGDDHVAAFEQLRVGILRRDVDAGVGADVLEQQHLVAHRLAQVGHDRQRLVIDHHQLGGVVRALARLAEHDGDDVADEPHLLRREEGPEHLAAGPG